MHLALCSHFLIGSYAFALECWFTLFFSSWIMLSPAYLLLLPRALSIFFEKVHISPLACRPLHRRPVSKGTDFGNPPYCCFRIYLSALVSFGEVVLSLAAKFCPVLSVSFQYHSSPPLHTYFSFSEKD